MSGIFQTDNGLKFDDDYTDKLKTDISSLQDFQTAISSGVLKGDAFDSTMSKASKSARDFATGIRGTSVNIGEFVNKSRMSEISLVAQNRSLANVRTLLNEYNQQARNCGVSQSDFVQSVAESNSSLGNYLSKLNGAEATMGGYISSLFRAKAATIGLQVASVALKTALSFGIALAIQGIVTGISHLVNKAKEARQANIEAGESAVEHGNSLYNLSNAYLTQANSTDTSAAATQSLADAQSSVISALGETGKSVDDLTGKYGSLSNAIASLTHQQLSTDISKAVNATKDAMANATEGFRSFNGTQINSTGTAQDKSGNKVREADIYKWLGDKGYSVDISDFGSGEWESAGKLNLPNSDTSLWAWDSDMSWDKLYQNYTYLQNAMNDIRETWGTDSKLYKQVGDAYQQYASKVEPVVEKINAQNNLVAEDIVNQAIASNDVPKNIQDFIALRGKMIDTLEASADFDTSAGATASGVIDALLSKNDSYKVLEAQLLQQKEKISSLKSQKDSLYKSLTGNDRTNGKNVNKDLSDRIDKMSAGDVEIAINLVAKAKYSSLGDLQEAVRKYKSDAKKAAKDEADKGKDETEISFRGLLAEKDDGETKSFSTKVDEYKSKLSELKDARDKIKNSEFKNDDFASLIKDFPKLATESINDSAGLTGAIEKQIEALVGHEQVVNEDGEVTQKATGLQKLFADELGRMDTAESVSQLLAYKNALIGLVEDDPFTKAKEDSQSFIDGLSKVKDALSKQKGGVSISPADFNSNELKDYRSALERVNGSMQLNAEKVREIAKAKADEQIATNNANKALAQTKYLENAQQIQKLRDALTKESSNVTKLSEARDNLNAELEEAKKLNVDFNKTKFGNIDTNNRAILSWDDNTLESYKNVLESWEELRPENDRKSWEEIKKDLKGKYSTVLGSYFNKGDIEGLNYDLAYSPLLQTDNGAKYLDAQTVTDYIWEIVNNSKVQKAKNADEAKKAILELDKVGMQWDDSTYIKGLIADVGDTAAVTDQQMHFVGKDGSIANLKKEVEKYGDALDESGTRNQYATDRINETISSLLEENSAIADTCDQYDLLSSALEEATGAYQNWLNAQSSSDYGDMAKDAESAAQKIFDVLNPDESASDSSGDYGSKKYKAALELVVPEDVDPKDVEAVQSYMDSVKQYMTFDDKSGKVKGLNIDKFLEDSVEKGLMTMTEDESGNKSFEIAGNKCMEDFAKGFHMSGGMIQAFFDELQLKGGEFSWAEGGIQTFGDLAVRATESAEALKSIDENKDLKIKIDVSDIDSTDEQMKTLDGTIEEMNQIKARPNVDPSEVEQANAVIQYCIAQKQILCQPDVMKIDTSQVDGDLGNAISLLQQFQTLQEQIQQQKAVGVDTGDAESKLKGIADQIKELPPDVKTKLSIDSTSVESISKSINEITVDDLVVKAKVNHKAVDGYKPKSKKCEVNYSPNTKALPTSFERVIRNVYYKPDITALPTSLPAITRAVRYIGIGGLGGPFSLNGTAHAFGTANSGKSMASGNWGTAPGGKTLVGELGREIVVNPRTGMWYTVGDNGAEFRDIPAGSIVFNHLQTEDLLANGYVAGRAHALASGTALASLHPVSGGITVPKRNWNPSGSSSGSSSSSSSKRYSSSKKRSSSKKKSKSTKDKNDKQIIDWIEIAINRIERAISNFAAIAESSYHTLADRIGATNSELSQMRGEVSTQQQAYNRYMKQADSVKLSSDLKKKVQNGTININEYGKDTADKIQEYQKWYEKALAANDAIIKLRENMSKLYEDNFNNVSNDYDNRLSMMEHLTNTYNNGLDDLEERGYIASAKYYEALSNVEKNNIALRQNELTDLIVRMSDAVNSGAIAQGSEAWYKMQSSINGVKESIQESQTALAKFNNEIRQLKWDRFDWIQKQIENITNESDFLIKLMSNSKLFTDKGQMTDTAMATMGLHGQNYNVYMAQADKYAEEIKAINRDIANDPNNTKLIDRYDELIKSQRDAINGAEEEKQAIKELVRDGIQKELDALKDLIDKYTDALDTEKDLYDYKNNIDKQVSQINSIQKQISAYSGDNSEETKATVQKLKSNLSDANKELEDTQYERYITDQKKLLDDLYDEYQETLNDRLDNLDALISDMIDMINQNSSSIAETINNQADNVGYTLSDSMQSIWSNGNLAISSVITKYGDGFTSAFTTVNNVLNGISSKMDAMIAASNNSAAATINHATATQASTPVPAPSPAPAPAPAPVPAPAPSTSSKGKSSSTKNLSDDNKKGIAAAIWLEGGSKSGWGDGSTRVSRLTKKFGKSGATAVQNYIDANGRSGNLYRKYHGKSLSKYHYNKFATGGLNDYTGIAWLDGTPEKPEIVLNSSDTSNFIALKNAMQDVAKGTSPLASLFRGNNGSSSLSQYYKTRLPNGANGGSVGEINYNINIPIGKVLDYNDFVNQLRKDVKFEKMIQSMTIDQLTGGSKVAKNKYSW